MLWVVLSLFILPHGTFHFATQNVPFCHSEFSNSPHEIFHFPHRIFNSATRNFPFCHTEFSILSHGFYDFVTRNVFGFHAWRNYVSLEKKLLKNSKNKTIEKIIATLSLKISKLVISWDEVIILPVDTTRCYLPQTGALFFLLPMVYIYIYIYTTNRLDVVYWRFLDWFRYAMRDVTVSFFKHYFCWIIFYNETRVKVLIALLRWSLLPVRWVLMFFSGCCCVKEFGL